MIVYRRVAPCFRGFVYLGTLHLKVVSVCHLGPAGCRCTMWGIIDLWSQWSVPSAVHRSGPDGAFSPGPAVINVSSRWKTMPQPSSSPHPLGDTCLHCTIHRLCFRTRKNSIYIKNSGHSNQEHICSIWTCTQDLEVWTLLCFYPTFPWCHQCQAHSDDQSPVGCLLSGEYEPHGVLSVATVNCLCYY